MAACTLCGYRSPVGVINLSECPVCGEPCDASDGRDGAAVESGQGVEHAGDGVSRGTSPLGAQPWRCDSSATAFPSSYLNPELQSLLRLVPEEKNRKKRAQDAVLAAGGALVPSCSDEGQSESDVVYIRPRIDPGMRVLKGRYNTQPRVAKAASMSVLERLAHPLMGYDSREALAPKARRRRQESVERLLRKTLAGGKANYADRPPWLLSRKHSSVGLSRACAKGARASRRCNPDCSIASAISRPPLSTPADTVNHQPLGGAAVGPLPQQRDREHDEDASEEPAACEARHLAEATIDSATEPRGPAEKPRDMSAKKEFPFFHLRASEKRRAKPSLRRKRVATMRSVNGWVRNADPASTRREVSLDRRISALRRGGKRASNPQPKVTASHGKYGRRHASRVDNGAFLTEMDSNGNPFVETRRGRGDGAEHSSGGGNPGAIRDGKRRASGRATNKGKPFRVGGSDLSEGNRPDSGAKGAGGRYGSAELGGRRARQRSGTVLDGGQTGGARTVPVAAPQHQRQHRRRDGARDVLGGNGNTGRAESMAEQGPTSPTRELAERAERSDNLDARDAAATAATAVDGGGQAPSDPREALDTARVWDREDGTLAGEGAPSGNYLQGGTYAHEVDGAMAPAWDNSHSQSTPTLDFRNGAKLAWELDGPTPTGHSRSAWQLLRGAEIDVPSQMKMLLHSFEDKVAARVVTPPVHDLPSPCRSRLPTPVIVDSKQQQQQRRRRASTPLPHEGRHRHRRPLSRGDKPPSEPPLEGGFIRLQPASRGWVRRQSLPSLLTDRAGPQSSSKPSTPTASRAGAAATRQRGKSRPSSEDSTTATRMQRLDGHYRATVGDAWDGRRGGTDRRDFGGRGTARGSQGLLLTAGEVPPIPSGVLQAEEAVVRAVSRGGRRSAPSGNILSNGKISSNGKIPPNGKISSNGKISPNGKILAAAVPRPLLYVGSPSGFKL